MAKLIESTPLSVLGDFNQYLKRTFIIRKNNEEKMVKIVKVRGNKIQLRSATDERANSFTISQAEFVKYYELVTATKSVAALAEEYKYDASTHAIDTTTKHYIPVADVPSLESWIVEATTGKGDHDGDLQLPSDIGNLDIADTYPPHTDLHPLVVEHADIPEGGEVVAHVISVRRETPDEAAPTVDDPFAGKLATRLA